jgi:hypothetical protein
MSKAMRVPMTYRPTSERVYWTVSREMVATAGRKPYKAWMYRSDDGCTRFGGETWLELVDRFSATADNYNMAHRLS